MTSPTIHDRLQKILADFRDPETGRTLAEMDQLSDVTIAGGVVRANLKLGTHSAPIADEVTESLRERIRSECGPDVTEVQLMPTVEAIPIPSIGQIGLKARSVIAVGSGKGGVGKSTVAASLALTLDRLGARVGLMDADVYGPSIPHLLNLSERPPIVDGRIQPIKFQSIPVMSMGLLIERDQPVIFRGPMLHGSITQFLRDTDWGELDYLIIDMPPGTGDVALTLSQLLPLAGAVVVCTPQQVALLDAVKALSMFVKTKIPVLGIVENMSGFICPDNNKMYEIFGKGGARTLAEEAGVPLLAELPINLSIRSESDYGNLAEALLDPLVRKPIEDMARALVRSLASQAAKRGAPPPLPIL